MSYKALYRVYRPKSFNEIKGQDHIQLTLTNILKNQKLTHAYLFSGPRGTGKTSVARIFAKAINCKFKDEDINPCEKCNSCKDANENNTLDIIEIDAASNNGVAEIRSIRNNIKFFPTDSEYKIYIIDEVHMLSKGAFNAFLKILEEPPEHVIFILATTEASKIPITILSRVQRFNFKLIGDQTIRDQLKIIFVKESIQYQKGVIEIIISLAKGSLRDALSIADQVASYSNNDIKNDDLFKIFGIVSLELKIDLLNWIAENNLKNAMKTLNNLIYEGANIKVLTENLISIIKDYIVYKITNKKSLLTILNVKNIEALKIDGNYSYDYLDILIDLLTQLSKSDIPEENINLAILKMFKVPNVQKKHVAKEIEYEKVTSSTDEFSTRELSMVDIPKVDVKKIDIDEDDIFQLNENKDVSENKSEDIDDILEDFNINNSKIDFGINKSNEDISLNDNPPLKETKVDMFKDEEIINLLVQFDPESMSIIKEKSKNLIQYITDDSMREYIERLTSPSLKLLSSGKDFILFATNDETISQYLNKERRQRTFINTIKKVFENDYSVYVLLLDDWFRIKEKYMQLQRNNTLPKSKKIERILERTDEERYGAELFGKLFSKT